MYENLLYSTCRLYKKKAGGITINLTKELSEQIKIPNKREIPVKYDIEKNLLIIGRPC